MFANNTAPADFRQAPNEIIRLDGIAESASRWAPYAREVVDKLQSRKNPNVYLFAGENAWERAKRRRETHGIGTALVLPHDNEPSELRWPPLDAVVVAWPTSVQRLGSDFEQAYRRKLRLAEALVRDGVRFAAIEHIPQFLYIYCEGGRKQ